MSFIANCPKRIPGGRECEELVDLFDIYPTIASFAGAELPTDVKIGGSEAPQ